jgi:hypothetical protein
MAHESGPIPVFIQKAAAGSGTSDDSGAGVTPYRRPVVPAHVMP